MSSAAPGAVAIWHDIAPEGRELFYAWHGEEHMLERVGIAGFRRGRRFVAIDAEVEFFNLYDADTLAVLKGPEYRARLNAPTPWSLRAIAHFRAVSRALCAVAAQAGDAEGGLIATLRYAVADDRAADHLAAVRGELLPGLMARPGVAAARLLVTDTEASGEMTAERRARGGDAALPGYTLLVEGWGDERPFAQTIRAELAEKRMGALGATGLGGLGFYRHQITIVKGG